jgi:hypothetical protein
MLGRFGCRRDGTTNEEVETMTYNLESVGLTILVGFSFGFGAIAQLVMGKRATGWLWLIGAVGWFIGGIVASEVIVGTMTVEEIQPIIGGLAFDEALLGGLIGGLIFVAATWVLGRSTNVERRMGGTTPPLPMAR